MQALQLITMQRRLPSSIESGAPRTAHAIWKDRSAQLSDENKDWFIDIHEKLWTFLTLQTLEMARATKVEPAGR